MKQSQMLIPTLKETPADAEIASHRLLLRAGFIRQNASGIYSYLPLGLRVLQKIEKIIREEMNRTGAQELLMPAIQPAELWHETGRWDVYGPELMRLKDRHNRDFALGATHEELITSNVRDELNSYKKLPMTLYQIQTKYRDEKRPRFGLLRGREFIMKDAYSFHADQEDLDKQYQIMYDAYTKVFERCGLEFRAVIADSGAMGGKDTHEFQALASVGEDLIAYSDSSDYAANIEMAEVITADERPNVDMLPLTEGKDNGQRTGLKYVCFKANEKLVVVYVREDDEINDVKVKNVLEADMIEVLSDQERAETGFDPFQSDSETIILADNGVKNVVNGTLHVEETNKDYINVNPERDLGVSVYHDLRFIKEGDPSPDGKGRIKFARGIEVGQIFKLGTKYSESMNAVFLDENGRSRPLIMGCYGIGVSRTLSAVAEQCHDENGLIWPVSVAPFELHIIAVNAKNEEQMTLADRLYEKYSARYEVLLDDRKERAGVKFAESDLIGCPLRITVGKKATDGVVELKVRKTGEVIECSVDELDHVISAHLND
ncbi:prolyl-tRNA synthetase [Scopulibacillus daqui]|uniref:Proline--tRNA ligase n=1 Tax=Scopulibacillus daqui TaxID=1469162 RepID=A0ABS2PWH2_9BACL|nr:proline--tRNA ligase [Scopulibacillus daqui]MBM7644382.1 prolyl-tRNA synthetase [Scopulibacillus daqui]